jgi:hypothetical protein
MKQGSLFSLEKETKMFRYFYSLMTTVLVVASLALHIQSSHASGLHLNVTDIPPGSSEIIAVADGNGTPTRTSAPVSGASATLDMGLSAAHGYRVRIIAITGSGNFPSVVAGGKALNLTVVDGLPTAVNISLTQLLFIPDPTNPTFAYMNASVTLKWSISDPANFLDDSAARMHLWGRSDGMQLMINKYDGNGALALESDSDTRKVVDTYSCSITFRAPSVPTTIYYQYGASSELFNSIQMEPVLIKPDLNLSEAPRALQVISTLPRTGQIKCYDDAGSEIECDGTGQDGDIQAGSPWPVPRFIDNNDGTITDRLTSLVWLKDANCFGPQTWADALTRVNNLTSGSCGLTDGSAAGEWRLPSVNELESLEDLQNATPPLPTGHFFMNVLLEDYWTSSTFAYDPTYAWYVFMDNGYVGRRQSKLNEFSVLAVRSASLAPPVIQLPRSGQSTCYDSDGVIITCTGSGQDGDLKTGLTWPVPRFTDNSIVSSPVQTVTDNLTGLIWSKDSNPAGSSMKWLDAFNYIASLNNQNWLGYNDWRVPNRRELMSLINREQTDSAAWLTSQGFTYFPEGFTYWSSSTYAKRILNAWLSEINLGDLVGADKISTSLYVWPVRGGYIQQKLTVTRNGSGTVTPDIGILTWIGNTGTTRIPPGETVTLTASAAVGFSFSGFTGCDAITSDNTCTVHMSSAKKISASFVKIPATLTVTLYGEGSGTITSVPVGIVCTSGTCQASFNYGALVMLFLVTDATSIFTGWSSGACSGTGSCSILMHEDKIVAAILTKAPFAINMTANNTPYQTLADALHMVKDGATIKLLGTRHDGIFSLSKSVNLNGGWNSTFQAKNGLSSVLNSGLTIVSGNSTAESLDIKVKLIIQGGSFRVKGVKVLP